jgi:hypothetical protein
LTLLHLDPILGTSVPREAMPNWVVRQDPIEFTGRVISVVPLVALEPALWTFSVRPDPPYQALLTTRNGNTNTDGMILCSVGLDPNVAGWDRLVQLAADASNHKVRVSGTWCDDDDSNTTAIRPLGILAVWHDIEVYDVDGWPVAVRDYDLYAFAHSAIGSDTFSDPHVNESRSLKVRLPFPMRPTGGAIPFSRAYQQTVVDHSDLVTFSEDTSGGLVELEATIETGLPAAAKGFYAAQIGLTFDEPELDQFCPPAVCDQDGKHCAYEGDSRFMRIPAQLPYAKKGDLALSPGDGEGFISGIVASLAPAQVYDHMGMFIDNGRTIRHCTGSMERLEDEDLFTAEISVKLAGVITLERQKVPLHGVRPDLLRFGWPGTITQTVEEVYRNGRNSLNPRWAYATTHPGEDLEDPERPGVPFRIYHLPHGQRQRRLVFNDPELDKGEGIVRLQDIAVHVGDPPEEHKPLLVRPHPQFEPEVRETLELVAEMAKQIEAHYRFFAYTRGEIGLDSSFEAPPLGDGSWEGLPTGASWPAGTIGAMCSSFVWTAVQRANEKLEAGHGRTIVLEDHADPPNPQRGLEYGSADGFYQYHADERKKAGTKLVNKIKGKIRERFDDQIPDVAYAALPQLLLYREITASNVANQTANAFALDACELLDESWTVPTEGETASPDNTLCFWDLKEHDGRLVQPEGRLAIYGDSVPLQLTAPQWKHVPLFRKQDFDLGTGEVTGTARIAGAPIAGATIRFDFGCAVATTSADPETSFRVRLGSGTHFAEGFILRPNPATGNLETFRTKHPLKFEIRQGELTFIDLELEPPPDLWRIIDVHLDADIHDRSFWGGDADAHNFHIDRWFELRQDLEDDPDAPEDQQNSLFHFPGDAWRTEPAVGSGVHVAVSYIADLDPSDRSVHCHCEVALIDTDSGGFLGIGTSANVDQLEQRDVVVRADESVDVLRDVDFSSNETVPERARVSLRLTNRRRPS